MTTPTPPKRIADEMPVFPCWLYGVNTRRWHYFLRDASDIAWSLQHAWSHWLPGSPEAPTVVPTDEQNSACNNMPGVPLNAPSVFFPSPAPESTPAAHWTPHNNPTGDWPEDFSHENGNYRCECVDCGKAFTGHKRRVQCKACATTPAAGPAGGAELREAIVAAIKDNTDSCLTDDEHALTHRILTALSPLLARQTEELATLRTLVAKKDEALLKIAQQVCRSVREIQLSEIAGVAFALTPAHMADMLATSEAEVSRWQSEEAQRTKERDAAEAEVGRLRGLLGMDTAWPFPLLLKALVVAESKFKAAGRDFDGWESIQTAAAVAQQRLDAIVARTDGGTQT